MNVTGFFNENRGLCPDLNVFFDKYKEILIEVFPNLKDKEFKNFEEMVNYQVAYYNKRAYWYFIKDSFKLFEEINQMSCNLYKINPTHLKNLYSYRYMLLDAYEDGEALIESVDILINSITGLHLGLKVTLQKLKE